MEVEPPQPAITLHAKPSLFDRITLYERVDQETVDNLLALSVNKAQSWCLPRYRRLISDGMARIEYTKPLFGRAVVNGAVGMHNMQRQLRYTLARPYFVDWDMKNAHPTMLLQISRAYGLQCNSLAHYVNHREACLNEVVDTYGVTHDVAKDLFLRMIFLGGFKSWSQQHRLPPTKRMTPLLEEFTFEMARLAHRIRSLNGDIAAFVRGKTGGEGNFDGAVLSTFLQEHECRVLETLFSHCLTEGLIKENVAVLCNDGFMLERALSRPELADQFRQVVWQTHGFNLHFVAKPMDDQAVMTIDVPAPLLDTDHHHKFYLRHLYPAASVYRMMVMDGVAPTQRSHRRLAFVGAAGHWWCDPEQHIKDWPSFQCELAVRHPLQLHFDELECRSADQDETRTCLREVVFDIDVTGFRRHCPCGTEKKACAVCWQVHIEGAALVLHHLLVVRLGLPEQRLLWVLSGMKGFHCLVNDRRYLYTTKMQRERLLRQLECLSMTHLKQFAASLEPEFVALVERHFERHCIDECDLLANEAFRERCFTLIREHAPDIVVPLKERWQTLSGGVTQWQSLKALQRYSRAEVKPSLLIALECYYPVIDVGPLGTKRHLYKAPFSVHAQSRAISLPVSRHCLSQPPLQLDTLCHHYQANNHTPHPHFATAVELFTAWLDHT